MKWRIRITERELERKGREKRCRRVCGNVKAREERGRGGEGREERGKGSRRGNGGNEEGGRA